MRGRSVAAGLAFGLFLAAAVAPALGQAYEPRAPAESPSVTPVALLPKAPAWKALIVLAVPRDLWSEERRGPDPERVGAWHAEHGPAWFREVLAPELREYLLRVTYGEVPLDIEVTPWLRLPAARVQNAPFSYVRDPRFEARDALREARKLYPLDGYRLAIVIDPISPADGRFQDQWRDAWGKFVPGAEPGVSAIVSGVFYDGTPFEEDPAVATARILAHEILHAVDFARDGRYDLLDNTGTNYCLHGTARGGEPWLCAFNEPAVLGVGPRSVGPGEYPMEPVEEGAGRGLRTPLGASDLFLEYRRAANPGVAGEEEPALLVWKVRGERADLVDIFRRPGRSIATGMSIEVLAMDPAGARVVLG